MSNGNGEVKIIAKLRSDTANLRRDINVLIDTYQTGLDTLETQILKEAKSSIPTIKLDEAVAEADLAAIKELKTD